MPPLPPSVWIVPPARLVNVPWLTICEERSPRVEARTMVPALVVPSAIATLVLYVEFVWSVIVTPAGIWPLSVLLLLS